MGKELFFLEKDNAEKDNADMSNLVMHCALVYFAFACMFKRFGLVCTAFCARYVIMLDASLFGEIMVQILAKILRKPTLNRAVSRNVGDHCLCKLLPRGVSCVGKMRAITVSFE